MLSRTLLFQNFYIELGSILYIGIIEASLAEDNLYHCIVETMEYKGTEALNFSFEKKEDAQKFHKDLKEELDEFYELPVTDELY